MSVWGSDAALVADTGDQLGRLIAAEPAGGNAGDLGPEGVIFIKADDSPNGKPLIVVSNEVSGSVTLFEVVVD